MPSPSRKKKRVSAGEAMQVAGSPEPALAYSARDSFAFTEAPPPVPAAAVTAPAPAAAVPAAAVAAPAPAIAAPAPAVAAPAISVPAALPALRPGAGQAAVSGYEVFAAFRTGPVEAVAEAGTILAKGLEEIGQSVVDLGHRQLASSVELAKAAFGTTTLRQFVELQTGFARASFDRWMKEGSRMTEISLKTADAAFQPLKQRVAQAMEKLGSAAA